MFQIQKASFTLHKYATKRQFEILNSAYGCSVAFSKFNPKNRFPIFLVLYLYMELKVFVTETIKEIIEGVVEAQRAIIPALNYSNDGYVQIGSESYIDVEFDVSVTSSESEGNEAKGGIFIKVVDLGMKNTSINNSSATNRIKFKVPVVLPAQANKKFN